MLSFCEAATVAAEAMIAAVGDETGKKSCKKEQFFNFIRNKYTLGKLSLYLQGKKVLSFLREKVCPVTVKYKVNFPGDFVS